MRVRNALTFIVMNRHDGKIYAMKCMKKDKIRREGKMHHVMNERLVLEAVRRTPDKETCPFIIQMHWAFQTVRLCLSIILPTRNTISSSSWSFARAVSFFITSSSGIIAIHSPRMK